MIEVSRVECDGCTLCCLALQVPWLKKQPGQVCPYCKEDIGCSIYSVRPDDCRGFSCAYSQAKRADEQLRPDRCNIFFERLGSIMLGTMHPEHNDAYNSPLVMGQIKAFLAEGFSVVIGSNTLKKPIVFPAKGKLGRNIIFKLKGLRAQWQSRHTIQI